MTVALAPHAPAAPAAKRIRHSGTARRKDDDRIVDLFRFPGLTHLAVPLERHRQRKDRRGRHAQYPALALLVVSAAARVTGSLASALTALQDGELWARCQDAFYARTEIELPDRAPTRDHVNELRKDIASDPLTMRDLRLAFTRSSVRQARKLGNLTEGGQPDWAGPDPRHVIFGDGTIVRRYSDAELITCEFTGRTLLSGSRARDARSARVQHEFRKVGSDQKNSSGINHVTLHTRTSHGLVVLAVGTELGAEQWTALDLLDDVAAETGDGVHTLVYDGALTGWAVEYAMARHGIQTFSKVPAASVKTEVQEYTRDEVDLYVSGVAREHGLEATGRIAKVLRKDVLRQMYRGERPTAVGTSIYPPSKPDADYDLVYSTYVFVKARHRDSGGRRCEHSLVLDDGALFSTDVDPISELLVKDEYLPAITSTRRRRRDGRWGTDTSFLVPCPDGDFEWTATWDPDATRYRRDSAELGRAPQDPFGWRMRAVPRHDRERFSLVSAGRNDSESFNRWFKDTLTNKRAATIDGRRQLLDLLLGAVVKNSDTWSTYMGR
ncbi:hypothetical protein [Cellulomonas endometrii]|uniref:hypothetical protein n=1 Tax=Cellulomonas endometrii TaxID=3036301 RepID=UPI0024AD5CAF|nr:hypothetical protein [Cellulomonas endometrii]